MAEAYPLSWPGGHPRTLRTNQKRAQFKATFGAAVQQIINELRLLGASYPVISTNQPLRRDGLPSATRTYIHDHGVAVYFLWDGKQRVLASDKWDRIEDNLRAVAKTIESMRGIERWGVSQAIERSFEGFTALPAPAGPNWESLLGVSREWSLDAIEDAYKRLCLQAHPDRGGSHERMSALNDAIAEARRYKRERGAA